MEPVMDGAVDLVGLTRSLVDIDSTTGREGAAADFLSAQLEDLGFTVAEQQVDAHRFNVFATVAPEPQIVYSTHFDCVPPFFPSRVENGRIYGRGSCDAKGILAAQIAAADQLRRDGETRVGMLFMVGEERGSEGAKRANTAADAKSCRYIINGEPTDRRLGLATRGLLRVVLKATGRAAHSSYPELGESAIDKLIDVLMEVRRVEWPADPLLGRTHYTVGLISGGVAPNVVPPLAQAELTFRTVSEASRVLEILRRFESRVALESVFEVPTVKMASVSGFETAVFPYTTDIPFLRAWGQPLLFGPGSIHVAHTSDEYIEIGEQQEAVSDYVTLARELLGRIDGVNHGVAP
ncbi:MAG TPA: M20/M25/M40 family metallo-hydrolase [Vicinamibacterales bacterium]|nr:M20/M25/M40 family metallo-hydrolase [Vicinamibacterales bacterium]